MDRSTSDAASHEPGGAGPLPAGVPAPRAPAGAAGDPGREAAGRLDFSRNKVTGLIGTGRVVVKPHRCRCRTCRFCGPIYGRRIRTRLLVLADGFSWPALLTLTLDPERFGHDPRRAYLAVTDGKFIARLMKHLGVKRWVWVLEFQKSGWPHWHLLIDKPGGYLDLKAAWAWWGWNRDGWKLGGVDLGKIQTKDGRRAVLYISKYLVKYPAGGFPDWVLDLNRRIRWVQASRAVGRLVADPEAKPAAVEGGADDGPGEAKSRTGAEDAEAGQTVEPATLRQRERECGGMLELLRELVDRETGKITYRFCGRLGADEFSQARSEGRVSVGTDEVGRLWVDDVGDMRAAIVSWIDQAPRPVRSARPEAPPTDEPRRCRRCGRVTREWWMKHPDGSCECNGCAAAEVIDTR